MTVVRIQLMRWLWIGIGAALLFNLSVLLHLFISPSPTSYSSITLVHVGNVLGWSLGALLCLRISMRRKITGDRTLQMTHQYFPLWISLAYFMNGVGEAISVFYYSQRVIQTPVWVHFIFLLQYPCFLCAVWSLPGSSNSPAQRVRILLDGLLLSTTALTWTWYGMLGHALLDMHLSLLAHILGIVYPCADLVLFLCVLRLSVGLRSPLLRTTRCLLLVGFLAIIPSDILNILSPLQGISNQLWITISASVGYGCIAIAVQMVRAPEEEKTMALAGAPAAPEGDELFPWWRILLPYALVPTVLGLMLWLWFNDRQSIPAQGVYLLGLSVIVQLLVRQVMTLREALMTNRRLRATHEALRVEQLTLNEVNEQLALANERLEQQSNELAQAYERQKQVQLLKDQFMLHVSHELRTPLTLVLGYLNLLDDQKGQLDHTLQEAFVARALIGTEELYGLISTIQEALESEEQVQAVKWEEVALSPLVQQVLEDFEPELRQKYEVECDLPPSLVAYADRQMVRRVLYNLLSNAFKYCPPSSLITVGARLQATPEGDAADPILVWIKDYGPGIPSDEMPQLFDRFTRLSRDMAGSIRGTGLGLSICKHLVQAMQGRIWIESSGIDGEGSRITFTLPSIPASIHKDSTDKPTLLLPINKK